MIKTLHRDHMIATDNLSKQIYVTTITSMTGVRLASQAA